MLWPRSAVEGLALFLNMIFIFKMPSPAPLPIDCRCECGALLARKVPGGVEIRCRRGRRSVVLALADLAEEECAVSPCHPPGRSARS
jgi:hypothetical protein